MSSRPSLRWALALLLSAGCGRDAVSPAGLAGLPSPAAPDRPESWAPYYEAIATLGDGFVVWESLREGHWRIWARSPDGSPERRLSPDEPGRDHLAAHIAPDGRHVVFYPRTRAARVDPLLAVSRTEP